MLQILKKPKALKREKNDNVQFEKRFTPDRYHEKRKTGLTYRYRLRRRKDEVFDAVSTFSGNPSKLILDVGTADGLMLEKLSCDLNAFFVGIDLSFEILSANSERRFHPVQADGLNLPFSDGVFDVVIAAAVIEHVPDGKRLLNESYRVLRKGGLCILTTPDPFFDWISTFIGHQEKGFHYKLFTLESLCTLFNDCGFRMVRAEKFMVSPIGFPFELQIEKIMKLFGLSALLLNQVVVGKKRI